MKEVRYRGHLIRADVSQTLDGDWTGHALICSEKGERFDLKAVTTQRFRTAEEAENNAIALAKTRINAQT